MGKKKEKNTDNENVNEYRFTERSLSLCNANLGQKIRYFRQIAGLTQKELAEQCEINESTIRNYELGNRYPDSDTLNDIASVLEVSIHSLTTTKSPNAPQSALKFLFDMEKYYLMEPVEIDGKMYISFDESKSDDPFYGPGLMEKLIRVWASFYTAYKSGEIDEDTYLLWQSKYPTFATTNVKDVFGAEANHDVTIDEKISDAKKRFRKTTI